MSKEAMIEHVPKAKKIAEESCRKLLPNPNTEKFHYEILETK